MLDAVIGSTTVTPSLDVTGALVLAGVLSTAKNYFLIFAGFSLVIFVHELGHFVAAKCFGVRVDKFAVGFGRELFGFTRGETRYSFNVLPLGGYVKMLGQEDFAVDKSGEWSVKEDPRAFTNKPVSQRMIVVSAGVLMNLVFAAFLFMIVFMVGMKAPSAVVGLVQPGMPAEKAGLRVGDKIVKVNSQAISDQGDLKSAIVLSDPDEPLTIEYERKDATTGEVRRESVTINAEMSPDQNVLKIGVAPPTNNTVALALEEPALLPEEQLQLEDEILEINGEKITSGYELNFVLGNLHGNWADVKIRRPARDDSSQEQILTVQRRAHMFFLPTKGSIDDTGGHLLGLVPRRRVLQVLKGSRAAQAGMKTGDIIARWGNQVAPRLDEINTIISENPERDIPLTVAREREGEKVLAVRPQVKGLFNKSEPTLDISLASQENDRLIVADIVTDVTNDIRTPAAVLQGRMPRGSLITKVNGQSVTTWNELADRFLELAGTDVALSWTYENQPEQSGQIYIPQTIGTTFKLPAWIPGWRVIKSIDGMTRREVTVNGKRMTYGVNNWIGAREVLRERMGQTVTIEYQGYRDGAARTVELTVTPEMLDTWALRLLYRVDDVYTGLQTTLIQESNPFKAMLIGIHKTWYFISQVYMTMKRVVFTRSVGIDQMSGPVGIIKIGSDFAAAGMTLLIYFLALLSANLAVINFLPLPIVDGGLFLFLLIEKIKGSPLSLKVQVATQVIGLVLIIGVFLFVTIQDFYKLATG